MNKLRTQILMGYVAIFLLMIGKYIGQENVVCPLFMSNKQLGDNNEGRIHSNN